jgi:hypothetical protein
VWLIYTHAPSLKEHTLYMYDVSCREGYLYMYGAISHREGFSLSCGSHSYGAGNAGATRAAPRAGRGCGERPAWGRRSGCVGWWLG